MLYGDSKSNLTNMRINIIGKDINDIINSIKDRTKLNNDSKKLKNIEDFWEINNKTTDANNLSISEQINLYLKEKIKHDDKNNYKDILIIKLENIDEKILELIYITLNESIDENFTPIIIFLIQESNSKLDLNIFDFDKKKYPKINQSLIYVKRYDNYINEFQLCNNSPKIKNLLNKCFSIINKLGDKFNIGEGDNITKYELEPEYDLSFELKYISLCVEAELLYRQYYIIYYEFDSTKGFVYLEQNIDLINKEKERIKQLSDEELFSEILNTVFKKNNRINYLTLNLMNKIGNKKLYELIENLYDNDMPFDEKNIKVIIEKLKEDEKTKKKFRNFCEFYLIKMLNIKIIIDKNDNDVITYTLEEEEESDEENEIEEKKDDDIDIDNNIDIEIPKEMKENWNNKDIKEILNELFPDDKINLKFIKENIENNNYTNELKNLYQINSEIIGDVQIVMMYLILKV